MGQLHVAELDSPAVSPLCVIGAVIYFSVDVSNRSSQPRVPSMVQPFVVANVGNHGECLLESGPLEFWELGEQYNVQHSTQYQTTKGRNNALGHRVLQSTRNVADQSP